MWIGWLSSKEANPSGTAVRTICKPPRLDEVCALGSSKYQVLAAGSTRDEVRTFGSTGNEVRAVGSDLRKVGTARGRSGRLDLRRGGPTVRI